MAYKDSYPGIDFEIKGRIAYLRFNNPATLNALSYTVFQSINDIFDELKKDRKVWGVILTGEGRSFIAGADLKDMPAFDYFRAEGCRDDRVYIHDTFNKIANYERPTIAAINGFALGGGAELAMCCDIRIASSKAKVGFPEVRLGGIPGYTGPSRAVKILGVAVAKEMLFTGRHYTADEALFRRFVTEVVEPEQLMARAEEIMNEIHERSPVAVKFGKIMCDRCAEMSYEASLEYERMICAILPDSEDYAEGMAAFHEKRKPTFHNN